MISTVLSKMRNILTSKSKKCAKNYSFGKSESPFMRKMKSIIWKIRNIVSRIMNKLLN